MKSIITSVLILTSVSFYGQTQQAMDNGDITQHSWDTYEWVDTCTAKYAVVHAWDGRCGIYDLEKKKNITELEYRNLSFSQMMPLEDGSQSTVFFGYKGHMRGVVSIGPTGSVMTVMMPDKDMTFSLDSCRTIDTKTAVLSRELLTDDMKKHNGVYGQVLVMESQTGNIKSWIALEKDTSNDKITDAPLLKHQLCADPQKVLVATMALAESNTSWTDSVDTKCGIDSIGDMLVKDHNWSQGGYGKVTYLEGFKNHSDIAMLRAIEKATHTSTQHSWNRFADMPREIDALFAAMVCNLAGLDGKAVVMPDVNTDSIKIGVPKVYNKSDLTTCHMLNEYFKATLHDGGIGSEWTTKNVDISGDYVTHDNCRPTLFDENLKDIRKYYSKEGLKTYNQVIFTGYFPSDNPRYTICVSMDNVDTPASGEFISNTVNKLAEYLNNN